MTKARSKGFVSNRFENLKKLNSTDSLQYDAWVYYRRYNLDYLPIEGRDEPTYIDDDAYAPDNRYINAFDKEIVDNRVNYAIGNPIEIKYDDSSKEIDSKIDNFKKNNNFDNFIQSWSRLTGGAGYSAVLIYNRGVQEELIGTTAKETIKGNGDLIDTRMLLLSPWNYALTFTSDGTETVEGIRYWNSYNIDDSGSKHYTYYGEYYDQTYVYYLESKSDNSGFVVTDFQPHGCNRVPIIELENNMNRKPSFYEVISLIDSYNALLSDFGNEMETFRHAYMVLKNYIVTDEDFDRMKTMRALLVDQDGDVRYLTKEINTEAFRLLIDTLRKNIERFSGNLDFSDPEVYGRATNLAISTRIKPLHNRAKTLSLQLTESLQKVFECVFDIWSNAGDKMYDWKKLDFVFSFDTPINDVEEADKLLKYQAIGISDEDIYQQANFLKEPMKALERSKKQKKEELNELGLDDENVPQMNKEEE